MRHSRSYRWSQGYDWDQATVLVSYHYWLCLTQTKNQRDYSMNLRNISRVNWVAPSQSRNSPGFLGYHFCWTTASSCSQAEVKRHTSVCSSYPWILLGFYVDSITQFAWEDCRWINWGEQNHGSKRAWLYQAVTVRNCD